MPDIEFYRDERGFAKARGEDHRLQNFLHTDLQESLELAEHLSALLKGSEAAEFSGNAHHVKITKKMAYIESLLNEDLPCRCMSRKKLARYIDRWCVLLASEKKDEC